MILSKPEYLTKAPPPDIITLGVRASKYRFWGDTNIQPFAGEILHFSKLPEMQRQMARGPHCEKPGLKGPLNTQVPCFSHVSTLGLRPRLTCTTCDLSQ